MEALCLQPVSCDTSFPPCPDVRKASRQPDETVSCQSLLDDIVTNWSVLPDRIQRLLARLAHLGQAVGTSQRMEPDRIR